jgi:hypothetical protein
MLFETIVLTLVSMLGVVSAPAVNVTSDNATPLVPPPSESIVSTLVATTSANGSFTESPPPELSTLPSNEALAKTSKNTTEVSLDHPSHLLAGGLAAAMQESKSFHILERNVKNAVDSFPDSIVSRDEKSRLRVLFENVFNDFRFRSLDDLEAAM